MSEEDGRVVSVEQQHHDVCAVSTDTFLLDLLKIENVLRWSTVMDDTVESSPSSSLLKYGKRLPLLRFLLLLFVCRGEVRSAEPGRPTIMSN